ncbi:MarR family winged helix-turn-helix transcriptional regulator [Enterovibrio norvegicus]|uniref:MarR family transcriptional regulator n=1 Tax=Enterovibrio norvegicus TaxID=188144 RepID=A0A2N7L571_9GAMM|nr:MarR family transcriptional regulator [Enterovibrio norvegicus]PML76236.1 MarR family transcriptional regulator [Enterovibrio norvegicus]PMN62095.1 MarR family transcriptional regulator [Enterovibrio norvegicus]PMN88630.1 MarR family transcriptional regulator [Enterovibrio norvegicus]TKF33350.1 MarR family transcriptional regulator [Enterovibrio norvegicus]
MSDQKSLDSLFQLAHALKRKMLENIEELELGIAPMNVRVLKIIRMKKNTTAIDIAHLLNRDKAQVTRLLNALIEQNLIQKEPNPEDKRSQRLRLTEGGEKILEQISGIDIKVFEALSEDVSAEEWDTFTRIADKMTRNLVGR